MLWLYNSKYLPNETQVNIVTYCREPGKDHLNKLIKDKLTNNWIFFSFLGLYQWHMEVPRLVVELELQMAAYPTATGTQDPSHICSLQCSLWQCWILNPMSEVSDISWVGNLVRNKGNSEEHKFLMKILQFLKEI